MNDVSAATLAPLTLLDDDERPVRLGSLWAERPVVLGFLRHFGCIFCRSRVAELAAHRREIEAAGARLVVVGIGSSRFAKAFREATGYDGALLIDDGSAYRALAFRRLRLWRLASPRLVLSALRARRAGHRQTQTAGDPWQLGGTLVIGPGEHVLYAWRNRRADDDAPVAEVLAAIRGAAS